MRIRNRKTRGRDAGGWPACAVMRGAERGVSRIWLRETGSLTARLQQAGVTTVHLLRQGLYRPNVDERSLARLPAGCVTPVREVVLCVDGRVAVYAHSVANRAARKLLRRAGRRALATVLFTDPRMTAGPLYFRLVDDRHPLYRAAAAHFVGVVPRHLPARRAMFSRGAARLLVTEVFLPWSPDPA